ncbi:SDR family oxidoreductase [Novosphingobium sp.]|uniref:SDR family NAD(P)-dependent oxidoreductase n=1 Tax=Novosphingobium sp. TaxID=1874826 RepID=UPI002638975F|nr:SDR family oxidoreductase [Novosphingobium sp.]
MAGDFDFSGKTILITGAASGIGAACARWLDARGAAELVLVDLDRPGLDTLGLSCKVRPYGGNVSDPALWALISSEIGRLDHAVINAGVPGPGKPIVDLDFSDWRDTMSVNLDGAFLALRCAMQSMMHASPDEAARAGSIVLTSSVSGISGKAPIDYGASKAAMAQMARIAANEGAPHGIRVNAIAPGGVDTPIWDKMEFIRQESERLGSREAVLAALAQQTSPLGRFASAEEIAGQIGFLLSNMAASTTGAVLVSDGGFSL